MPPPPDDLARLLAEERFVRDLARRLVGPDGDDVAQQAWMQALACGAAGVARPRHWLARIVRRVAANARRSERRREERERGAALDEAVPSSAELAEREERRRALVAAIDALPPSLRAVMLLRWFEGLPPRRIAARLDVPVATVWTQLRRGLELLRARLDATHGKDWRALVLPLTWLAPPAHPPSVRTPSRPDIVQEAGRGPLPAAAIALQGATLMAGKSKLLIGTAVVLATAGLWWLTSGGAPPPDGARSPGDDPPGRRSASVATSDDAADPAARGAIQRAPVPDARVTPPSTATLVVHASYADDGTAAAGHVLTVSAHGTDPRFGGRRVTTDAAGIARFDELPPGAMRVQKNGDPGHAVELVAGETRELDYAFAAGVTVDGRVVDVRGAPVPDAIVEATMMAHAQLFPEVVATTDRDGRFTARALPRWCLIGARAPGHAASPLRFVHGQDGNTATIEIVVGDAGGAVAGRVETVAGAAVQDAVVIVGEGELSGVSGRDNAPPFPALVRTDTDGRFVAIGVLAGEQRVQVRAAGLAPWTGSIEVAAGATVRTRIVLEPGATIRGRVRDADGAAVAAARIVLGDWDDLAHFQTRANADGSFELDGLPPGELVVRARHDELGRAEHSVRAAAGETVDCELVLSRGLVLRGRIVDERDAPIAGAVVECRTADRGWSTFAQADDDGRFAILNCPEDERLHVRVSARAMEELQSGEIDPRAGELTLRMRRGTAPSVRIAGVVAGPDGRPVANAMVSATRVGARGSGLEATDQAGRFELGPLVPGTWQLMVQSSAHPDFRSEPRELAADAVWELGTITLPVGGTVAITPRPAAGLEVGDLRWLVYTRSQQGAWPITRVGDVLRGPPLAAGEYLLLVQGGDVAARGFPFAIRAGEETVVDAPLVAGVERSVEVVWPAGTTGRSTAVLRVHRGDALEARGFVGSDDSGPATVAFRLRPDSYRVTVTSGERSGAAELTVADPGAAPVRVVLR